MPCALQNNVLDLGKWQAGGNQAKTRYCWSTMYKYEQSEAQEDV